MIIISLHHFITEDIALYLKIIPNFKRHLLLETILQKFGL